ncbi:PglL family O-oligosaccharyltransferase [Aquitalea aquatica]|uniref:O-antigen ligase C-terminal domain-containing protein n=1 Tax=Aquitalea aquatica TaxID=3044273 RepID=A0A838Y3B9_9NEIS|nr:Wzy polymerase domain-containing protein [Aquitalea magnusonii]MBA4709940.1 O-antigen ligase C-terminal domain-containing protein [Aquitalea magnusonii]
MSFPTFSRRLALLAFCLIAIMPFASRIHFVPLPQWFGEMNVVWLMLAAAVYLLPSGMLFERVPRASWWCLLLAIVWALQPQLVHALFPGMSYATALAWLAVALLAGLSYSLQQTFGSREFAVWLARAIIVGGLVQSLIGLAQLTGLANSLGLFYDSAHPTTNIFGHIGQRNQYAHYLMWSVVSGVYLFAVDRMVRGWLVLLVLWLGLMLAYAASRTTLLYLLVLTLLGGLWHWRMQSAVSRRLMWAMLLSCVVVFAAQFALPLVNHLLSLLTHATVSNASGVERLAANGDDMGSRRLAEMGKAWLSFKSHPLWGVGWSQYAAESVRLQPLPQFASAGFNSGLFTNCHNLILQLLVEMGLPITLLVVGGFAWVIWPFFSEQAEAEGMLALGCMAVTLIHSMLEYPLWYLYFLAMLVVFASMSPARTGRAGWLLRAGWMLGMLFIGYMSVVTWSTYNELVGLYTQTDNPARDAKRQQRLAEIMEQHPLFAYHALSTLDDYLVADKDNLARKLQWEERLTAFRPYPDVMMKKAQMLALAGREAEAKETVSTALASFPTYAKDYLDGIDEDVPAWQPLRAIAQQVFDRLPAKYRGGEGD